MNENNTEILKYVFRTIMLVAIMVVMSAFVPNFNDKLVSLFGDIITSSLSFFFGIATGAAVTYKVTKKNKFEGEDNGSKND